MKKTTIQPPKNMSARKLIDTFAQNTPFTTKGIYYVSKDDVGNENTTIFLTADLDLALKAGDIAERRRVDEAMQGTNRGDIEFFSIFTHGLSEILDSNNEVKEEFSNCILYEKGNSLNNDKKFNYPSIVITTDSSKMNMFTQLVADTHLNNLSYTKNSHPSPSVDYMIAPLNISIATANSDIATKGITTIKMAHNCEEITSAIIQSQIERDNQMDK